MKVTEDNSVLNFLRHLFRWGDPRKLSLVDFQTKASRNNNTTGENPKSVLIVQNETTFVRLDFPREHKNAIRHITDKTDGLCDKCDCYFGRKMIPNDSKGKNIGEAEGPLHENKRAVTFYPFPLSSAINLHTANINNEKRRNSGCVRRFVDDRYDPRRYSFKINPSDELKDPSSHSLHVCADRRKKPSRARGINPEATGDGDPSLAFVTSPTRINIKKAPVRGKDDGSISAWHDANFDKYFSTDLFNNVIKERVRVVTLGNRRVVYL
ncbi:hypothetical protein TcasGA2_TC003880 [Tribolium castaneum]|uniref:Uncharacterized protein n=1 Tax=Tribolium castaneum TaxID=7070 RepID=D6WH50_TRICA|nr:hypothetical protein TcasGA2_TC003880 [Tribolium castaneum]